MMQLIALLFIGIIMSIIIGNIPLIEEMFPSGDITLGMFQIGILLIWSMFSFAAFTLDM